MQMKLKNLNKMSESIYSDLEAGKGNPYSDKFTSNTRMPWICSLGQYTSHAKLAQERSDWLQTTVETVALLERK